MSNVNFTAVSKRMEQGARDLQWVIDVAKKLKEIGSIEQAESDIQKRYNSTSKDMAALQTKVEFAEKELKALRIQKTEEEQIINNKIEAIKKVAEDIRTKAQIEGDNIITEALEEAKVTRDGLKSDLKSLEDRVKTELVKLSSVKDEVRKARDSLVSIETKVSSAKERAMKAYQETFRSEIE